MLISCALCEHSAVPIESLDFLAMLLNNQEIKKIDIHLLIKSMALISAQWLEANNLN